MAEKLESEMLFLSLLHLLCSQTGGGGGGKAHTYAVVCPSVRATLACIQYCSAPLSFAPPPLQPQNE